jgi:hypothetical protein
VEPLVEFINIDELEKHRSSYTMKKSVKRMKPGIVTGMIKVMSFIG